MNWKHFEYLLYLFLFFLNWKKSRISKLIASSNSISFQLYLSMNTCFKIETSVFLLRLTCGHVNLCIAQSQHNINGRSDQIFQTICKVAVVLYWMVEHWILKPKSKRKRSTTSERDAIHLFHIHDLAEFQCSKLKAATVQCALSLACQFVRLLLLFARLHERI